MASAAAVRSPRSNQLFVASLLSCCLLLLLLINATQGWAAPASSFTLRFKANTPVIKDDGNFQTFFANVNSSLVPSGTTGMFWGTIPETAVLSVCKFVSDTGRHTIPASSITAYGRTVSSPLRINAITGCGAAGNGSAVGVEALLTAIKSGRRYVVACYPQFNSAFGCAVFMTGSDVSATAEKLKNPTAAGGRPTCNDNRADCTAWGASKCSDLVVTKTCPCMCNTAASRNNGVEFSTEDAISCGAGVAGGTAVAIGGAIGCALMGPLAPFCYGLTLVGFAVGSVASCAGSISGDSDKDKSKNGTGGCFPAHARVLLRDGSIARMDQLQLGQEVAVRQADGTVGYEPIYAWGHKERNSGPVRYVQIDLVSPPAAAATAAAAEGDAAAARSPSTSSAAQLVLTPGHFVVMPCHDCRTSGAVTHKRADDVVPGDELWVAPALAGGRNNESYGGTGLRLELWRVKAVRYINAEGLYNPFTLGGTVIVEGVAASCHSDWFLDSAVDMLGLNAGMLPPIYQAAMSPFRMLWHLYGKERYIRTYEQLDAAYDIASMCAVKAVPPGTGKTGVLSNALQTAASSAQLMVTSAAALATSSWDVKVASSSNTMPGNN